MCAYTYAECFIKDDYTPFNLNNAFIKIGMFGIFKYIGTYRNIIF